MTIARAITTYREKQGLTQSQLGDRIGRSRRTIIRYETGDIVPSLEILKKIFPHVDIEALLYLKIMEG